MKRLFLVLLVILGIAFGFSTSRRAVFAFAEKSLASFENLESLKEKVPFLKDSDGASGIGVGRNGKLLKPDAVRKWTLTDGREVDAVLVAADAENVQLRIVKLQSVYQAPIRMFSESDRELIHSMVQSEGHKGVLGFPLSLKTHSWPDRWRGAEKMPLQRIGESNRWRSEHFEITNTAGLNPEAMSAIVRICESVDGALSALPLPLPVNWGRPEDKLRKIQIEHESPSTGMSKVAGYWDPGTGIVHVYADLLLEPNRQLVVFEFDKPEKVQKYDTIVHEVTHQSTAALIYLNVPAWVPEGLAEYMAATQYAPAAYQFNHTHVSLEYHINKWLLGDRIVKDRKMHLVHLEKLMNRDIQEWNLVAARGDEAGRLQYDESLLLMDYFIHRDHRDGVHFRRYLECVLSGMPEPEARDVHLMRGRTYEEIERKLIDLWEPLGLTINFQDRGQFQRGDVTIDWAAEDVKRTIAAKRASLEENVE